MWMGFIMFTISFKQLELIFRYVEMSQHKIPNTEFNLDLTESYGECLRYYRRLWVDAKMIFSLTKEYPTIQIDRRYIGFIVTNLRPTIDEQNTFFERVGI